MKGQTNISRLRWKVHVQNLFPLRSYTMHASSNRKTFPLICSSVRSKQLLPFVHGQCQKSEHKDTAKKQRAVWTGYI